MAGKSEPQPTLEEQIAQLQAQIATLIESGAETASTAAKQAKATGAAAATAVHDRVEVAAAGVADEIKARPLTSIVIALAFGWLVGRFVSR
ncbi:hypothetical protein [Elioraea sp.]|jgi:ElaB/YqjD/DUF883 family membrane-anchored ribosome-binding protein|uniref:hypothetical protein n=1 Tax=Elioraea sp. TaxID=2185103 RepID=UPI003F71338C